MTNFEYWKDDILKITEKGSFFGAVYGGGVIRCSNLPCSECIFKTPNGDCTRMRYDWLYAEHVDKPALTKKERMFCELVGTGYIARDGDGKIFYYKHMPARYDSPISGNYWSTVEQDMTLDIHIIDCLRNGFEFIKGTDMEVWDVEELLKLEVREEKDN